MTTSGDLTSAPASALVRAIRAREVSSRELLDAYLERIEQVNPAINAVVTIDAEVARAAAEQTARGQELGALHGLPMTVKDVLETAGMRTTSGFPDLAQYVPVRDADAVARLRGQGGRDLRQTNLPMFAMDWQMYNPIFGTTNNPWYLTRTPGGSSGGPAAAVAAGMTALDLGSDLSGSLRQPAHTTGVFTPKPSFGVVSGRVTSPGRRAPSAAPTWRSWGRSVGRPTTWILPSRCSPDPTSGQRPPGSSVCRRRVADR